MIILISNDDSIHAPGIHALAKAAETLGEVWVVAPAAEQSAKSHALTMHEPLRVREVGERRFSVNGTPADSVYMALTHILPRPPDVVLSGVNRGANLGSDVHYSGTVAAAREAALRGVAAVASSLHITDWTRGSTRHYDVAAEITAEVAAHMLRDPLPKGRFVNVNVPDMPRGQIRGICAAPVGERIYANQVVEHFDPRGKPYYWIGGPSLGFAGGEAADGQRVANGYVSVTPMRLDPTDHATLGQLAGWFSKA